jgi:formiminotetrahydrofolate cyclodeaminase
MRLEEQTVGEFLEAVASKTPTPGGGAVAGQTAATGIALAEMVLAFSIDKKSLADMRDRNIASREVCAAARGDALRLADADAVAYGALNALWKLDENDPVREAQWDDAVDCAIAVPLEVLDLCERIVGELDDLVERTNPLLASDLAIAAVLVEAAARSALWNIRINLPLVRDKDVVKPLRMETARVVNAIRALAESIESRCAVDG